MLPGAAASKSRPGLKATREIVLIGGCRTAFGSFGGSLKDFTATDLGVFAAKGALERSHVAPEEVEHVIFGNALQTSNDAIYLALARLEPRSGRKVVLVLSDGVDIESVLSMASVRAHARRSGVILYWLRLGESADAGLQAFTPWRDAEAHRREGRLLNESVVESGGRRDLADARRSSRRDAPGVGPFGENRG